MISKKSLSENQSIISLDLRFNLGTTNQILKKVALIMLRNISILYKDN
jgi:hypothetical protein